MNEPCKRVGSSCGRTSIHCPETNPLRRNASRIRKFGKRYRSPLYQVADALKDIAIEELETINPFTLAPWEKRVQTITDETAAMQADAGWAVRIAVSSSARNDVVGMGGVVELPASGSDNSKVETFSSTLGTRSGTEPYSGELAAMAYALRSLPKLRFRSIVLLTSNRAAALTLGRPRQQSGQDHVCHSYEAIRALRRNENTVKILWLPASEGNELLKLAKEKAKMATQQGATPQTQIPSTRSTTLSVARSNEATPSVCQRRSEVTPKESMQHSRQTHSTTLRPTGMEGSQSAGTT